LLPPELYESEVYEAALTLLPRRSWKMLRLRIRVCRDSCVEMLGIANTGFIGSEPEIMLPHQVLERIVESPRLESVERVLADGSRTVLRRTLEYLDISAVEEDRIVGPVKAKAYMSRGGSALLNDKLLDELGKRISRSH